MMQDELARHQPDVLITMTLGFLNFLMAMGVAGGASPTHAEGLDAGFPAVPFFAWKRKEEGTSL